MNLSREVLWNVFSYIGHKSFNKCRRVCKQWKQIIDSADFRAFYGKSQAHNFSEYIFSMFDDSGEMTEMPAKFVSIDNFRHGFVTTTQSSQIFRPTLPTKELLEHEFQDETDKLCLSYSVHGNRNNWNMTLPNLMISPSTLLDQHFTTPTQPDNHHLPRSLTPDEYNTFIQQRDLFYSQLCKTQKYGFMIPLTEG